MNEITYLDYVQESYPNGRKPAKISQEKIRNLKNKYDINWKTLKEAVKTPAKEATNVAPFPSVQPTVSTPTVNNGYSTNAASFPNVNQVNSSINIVESVNRPVVKNYENVVRDFNITVYEKSLDEEGLAGARKIRISQKTANEVKGCDKMMAHGKLENIIPFPTKSVEIKPVSSNIGSNINEFQRTQTSSVNSSISPSVDDYLQKDKPSIENGIILQLAGDVESLKEETVKQSALLEQLEAKYNDLKAKREQRIKDLEDEKLSYTATLEGLTERIRNLQEAIQQEEQSLSGSSYRRAA